MKTFKPNSTCFSNILFRNSFIRFASAVIANVFIYIIYKYYGREKKHESGAQQNVKQDNALDLYRFKLSQMSSQ